MKHRPAGSDVLDGKMNHALPNLKPDDQRALLKLRIEVHDPALEVLRAECGHVSNDDGVEKLPDGFSLLLTRGVKITHLQMREQEWCRESV